MTGLAQVLKSIKARIKRIDKALLQLEPIVMQAIKGDETTILRGSKKFFQLQEEYEKFLKLQINLLDQLRKLDPPEPKPAYKEMDSFQADELYQLVKAIPDEDVEKLKKIVTRELAN